MCITVVDSSFYVRLFYNGWHGIHHLWQFLRLTTPCIPCVFPCPEPCRAYRRPKPIMHPNILFLVKTNVLLDLDILLQSFFQHIYLCKSRSTSSFQTCLWSKLTDPACVWAVPGIPVQVPSAHDSHRFHPSVRCLACFPRAQDLVYTKVQCRGKLVQALCSHRHITHHPSRLDLIWWHAEFMTASCVSFEFCHVPCWSVTNFKCCTCMYAKKWLYVCRHIKMSWRTDTF